MCDEIAGRTLEDSLGTVLAIDADGFEVCVATLGPDGVKGRLILESATSPFDAEGGRDAEEVLVQPELAVEGLEAPVFFGKPTDDVDDCEIPVASIMGKK